MDNPKVGSLLNGEEQRDAIHIAIAPIIAAQQLKPGQCVGLAGTSASPIGIVDPFLKSDVRKGDRFWMFLYPNTITSLRHDWTHPAFLVADKSQHEVWMRKWAMEHMNYNYNEENVTENMAYAYAIEAGRTMSVGCCESARDYIDNEWWTHWEAITGEAGQRDEYFSCSC